MPANERPYRKRVCPTLSGHFASWIHTRGVVLPEKTDVGLRSVPVDTFEICRSVLTMSVMSLYQTKGPIGWKRASIASLPRRRNVALRTADGILRLSPIVVLDPFEDRSAAPLIGVLKTAPLTSASWPLLDMPTALSNV